MSNAEEYSQALRQVYHKHIIQNKYTKHNSATHVIDNVPVEAIANAMQAHTNQTLQELKEKVEEFKGERDAAYLRGKILQLIDEAQDV